MKMVKSLLLGAAAGIVAVAGAQAADLPAKAKPVDYVKVCGQYGAGFFVIPGTETCLDISGYVRVDYYINEIGAQPQPSAPASKNDTATRSRAVASFDARSATEHGTLRSFMQMGATIDSGGAAGVYLDRAFIQWAGFTFGYTQSFFDAWHGVAYTTPLGGGGNLWTTVLAYTMQFGGGWSATISLEDGTFTAAEQAGELGHEIPDIVANIRVDQAWGYAQIAGVVHQIRNAGASDDFGFAIGGALQLNIGGSGAQMNTLHFAATYADGASRRVLNSGTPVRRSNTPFNGASVPLFDAVGADATEAFTVGAAARFWLAPTFNVSIFGSYFDIDHAGVVNDYDGMQIGARGVWTAARGLDIGVEVLYTKIDWAPLGVNDDSLGAMVRVQRNF
jgi:Porin subfamily